MKMPLSNVKMPGRIQIQNSTNDREMPLDGVKEMDGSGARKRRYARQREGEGEGDWGRVRKIPEVFSAKKDRKPSGFRAAAPLVLS